jgi:hypothetical protein
MIDIEKPTEAAAVDRATCIAGVRQVAVDDSVRFNGPCRWPFKAEECSPLTWWRRLPPEMLCDAERRLLSETIKRIAILDAWRRSFSRDARRSHRRRAINEIPLRVDVALTALTLNALDGDAALGLVMAQVIGLTNLGHDHSISLATSWFAQGQRHSSDRISSPRPEPFCGQ